LVKRDNRNRGEILKRVNAQFDQSAKIAKADFVIRNDGPMQMLQQQCEFLFHLFSTISEKTSVSRSKGAE
jgi:dephospho-CoA kinase